MPVAYVGARKSEAFYMKKKWFAVVALSMLIPALSYAEDSHLFKLHIKLATLGLVRTKHLDSRTDDPADVANELNKGNPCIRGSILAVRSKLDSIQSRKDFKSSIADYEKSCGSGPSLDLRLEASAGMGGGINDGVNIEILIKGASPVLLPYRAGTDDSSCSSFQLMSTKVDYGKIGDFIIDRIKSGSKSCIQASSPANEITAEDLGGGSHSDTSGNSGAGGAF